VLVLGAYISFVVSAIGVEMKSAAGSIKQAYIDMVNELGESVSLAPVSGTAETVKLFTTPLGKDDQHLINAFGVDARVGKMLATPLAVKFDTVIMTDGTEYVVQAVHEVRILDERIGQTLILTGDPS
jgi:hypothetical protein